MEVTQKFVKHKRSYPPAIKPGTYSEYLKNHPEVVDEGLRKMGIDPDELHRMLMEGGTVLINLNNFKNATIKKVEEET